ncbi:MAG: ubiquinol oxidase subunit II [Pseudomonadota bacterium]
MTSLFRIIPIIVVGLILSGCDYQLLYPSGDIAVQQRDLIIYSTVLMLIVIIPVIGLTLFFAWRYRESNTAATYEPEWDHSISLEVVIWAVPLAIIICLGSLTWVATHRLNPYDDLRRIAADTPINENVEPLQIQVVSMDWKWAFIYPQYDIATVNEAATIVDRPIEFKITSNSVMNAFFVPSMAGMIYAMAGMETELNAVMNKPGKVQGFAGQYSGAGHSHMYFDFHTFDEDGFDAWVSKVRAEANEPMLTRDEFLKLAEPTENHPVTYFASVEELVWDRIINMCVGYDRLCQNDMMMVDALGGGGLEGLVNREMFAGICSVEDPGVVLALIRKNREWNSEDILAAMSEPVAAPMTSLDAAQQHTLEN